jgi:hypothetical protein
MIVTLFKQGKDGRLLYFTVHDRQQSLTSVYALTSAFRMGNGREREKHYDFDTLAEMDGMIRTLLSRRIKDGYRLLYSWSRDARWSGADSPGEPGGMSAGLLSRASAAHDRPGNRASG